MSGKEFNIPLDGKWDITDLGSFSSLFSQLYSFCYFISNKEDEIDIDGRSYFFDYPWRGGFSTVNFFLRMYKNIPQRDKVEIKRLQYASPGLLVVTASLPACMFVVKLIQQFIKLCDQSLDFYNKIQRQLSERKLKGQSVKDQNTLSEQDKIFCEKTFFEFSAMVGLTDEESEQLLKDSENPLAALKILLSVFRRVRALTEQFEVTQKTGMTDS